MAFLSWVRTQWDRSLAIGALIGGLIALLVGYLGVSNTPYVAKQLPYVVSGGLLGVCLVGIAAAMWLSADLRDEWRELRGLRLTLREEFEAAALDDLVPVENGESLRASHVTSLDAGVALLRQN